MWMSKPLQISRSAFGRSYRAVVISDQDGPEKGPHRWLPRPATRNIVMSLRVPKGGSSLDAVGRGQAGVGRGCGRRPLAYCLVGGLRKLIGATHAHRPCRARAAGGAVSRVMAPERGGLPRVARRKSARFFSHGTQDKGRSRLTFSDLQAEKAFRPMLRRRLKAPMRPPRRFACANGRHGGRLRQSLRGTDRCASWVSGTSRKGRVRAAKRARFIGGRPRPVKRSIPIG